MRLSQILFSQGFGSRRLCAGLIHHAQVAVQRETRRKQRAIDQRVIQERLGAERADLAPIEEVIERHSALAQRAARLVACQVHVLEAGEQAGLEVADAIHQAEVELTFALALAVEVFAFRLESVVLRKRREVTALTGERRVAVAGRAHIHAEHLKAWRSVLLQFLRLNQPLTL